ncbi:hypothetical protein [Mameliella sediminis]|uniref:hypothetical protein n=1 Tax=Mameliella sediminis TaxID=2836866 RepID=UPI001C48053B|nr:hypothetical protein [Mameliella sediminis]MBV7395144.1 hypothetical protein [Mameliella sediminis]
MRTENLIAPGSTPSVGELADWRDKAHQGGGSPWLRPAQADALARYALKFGEGVQMMEAVAPRFREPPRDISWEILGIDDEGENWSDHRDPQKAYALFRSKLSLAEADGAVLHYKLWLSPAG